MVKKSDLKKLNSIMQEGNEFKNLKEYNKAVEKYFEALSFVEEKVKEPEERVDETNNIKSQIDQIYSVEIIDLVEDATNSIDKEEVPVLFWAIDSGQIDVIEELLRAGANVNYSDDSGLTPLMISVGHGRADILRLMIKYGAVLDAQNSFGGTAASYAKEIGAVEDLEVLRKAGAKIK